MKPALYFFDTYAFIAAAKGHPAYGNLFQTTMVTTTVLNLLEAYYKFLEGGFEKEAETLFPNYEPFTTALDAPLLIQSAHEKLALRKKTGLPVSYVDAIGYACAKRNGLKFLTGDRAFKELPYVQYVP